MVVLQWLSTCPRRSSRLQELLRFKSREVFQAVQESGSMSEPRRSSRVKKPVISASKPSAARSSRKQAKGAPIPRASLAGLPVELQFMIFSSVPRPPMRRLVEHGPHQAQIAQLSLICKSTLGAARSALHLAPFFSYRSGAPRTALIKAFGLDEEDGNGNAFGRMMERFTCPNWPNGANNKLHRNTLLEGVLDVASLTTLHLLANDNMNHKSINVHEVITAFLSADQGLDSLVNLRLEGFSTTKLQLVSLCNFLCSSPKLESLHLVLGTLRHATPALHTYPIRPSNYHLRYVHIEFYDLRSGDELSKLVRSLPPSIITLALFVTAWDTVTLGANLLDTLPNLRYLALCYYYLDNLKLP